MSWPKKAWCGMPKISIDLFLLSCQFKPHHRQTVPVVQVVQRLQRVLAADQGFTS
jgi:hypothetical protein